MTSLRLDEALVARGLSPSRSRARDAVLRGTVKVNGQPARKPSQTVFAQDALLMDDKAGHYVSRAALKLLHGLDHFQINAVGRHAVDIGASTGGFTQVLLERGATHVTAVDVGHGQMVPALANDPRITLLEGLNAREMTREHVPEDTTLIVSDVSFISLKLVLPPVLDMMESGAEIVALIKPQFEVGRGYVGRGGLVTDPEQHTRVCDEIKVFLEDFDWAVKGIVPSPMEGGDGNLEFLIAAVKR